MNKYDEQQQANQRFFDALDRHPVYGLKKYINK